MVISLHIRLRFIQQSYDRAALVALPEPMREQYIAQCKMLSEASSQILLITLEYDASRMQGPPFSVTDQQVRSYGETG